MAKKVFKHHQFGQIMLLPPSADEMIAKKHGCRISDLSWRGPRPARMREGEADEVGQRQVQSRYGNQARPA